MSTPRELRARGVIAVLVAAALGLVLSGGPASAGASEDRRLGERSATADPDSPLQQWIRDRLATTTLEQAIDDAAVSPRQSAYLCTGYSGCKKAGYPNHGYRAHSGRMYWNMYSGHNCTNYVAYRMVRAGMPNRRPWGSGGSAMWWGVRKPRLTNSRPMVGAVAWWKANTSGAGSSGHVAYVERVVSARTIVISEDSWSGDFHWRRITRGEGSWPTGFIHFADQRVRTTESPRLSEDPRVGDVLRLDRGSWSPRATTSVRWFADGELLPDVTGSSLRLTPELLGTRIEVRVRAEASGYRDGVVSVVSARVRRGPFEMRRAPEITGHPRVGHELAVRAGAWAPSPELTQVQWLADGRAIPGATRSHLRLTPDLLHRRISVRTRVGAEGYRSSVAESGRTDRIERGRIHLRSAYGVRGPVVAGRQLQVVRGETSPAGVTADYQWLRGTHAIKGATGRGYTTTGRDLGQTLAVRITLRSGGYEPRTLTLTEQRVVRTRPTLTWDAVGKDHKAVVKLSLSALGLDRVRGPVTVTVGRTSVTQRLQDGAALVVVRRLEPGTRQVTVAYPGRGDLVLPVSASGTVRVRRH